MKIFNKFFSFYLSSSLVLFPASLAVSCSGISEQKGPQLPKLKNNKLDFSLKKLGSSENYRFDYNKTKMDEYINYGSEKFLNKSEKNNYLSKRKVQYRNAWDRAFQEAKNKFQIDINKEISKNISFDKLSSFSLNLDQIHNLPENKIFDFLGTKVKLKLSNYFFTFKDKGYLEPNLESNEVKKRISNLQKQRKFIIIVSFNFTISVDDKNISDFTLEVKKETEIELKKTLGEFYDQLIVNLNELPQININWDAPEIKNTYFDGVIANEADGDTYTIMVTDNHNNNSVKIGDRVKVRLSGIDTPEKAVDKQQASAFEQSFALLSSKFVSQLMNNKLNNGIKVGDKLRVGFSSGIDTFLRTLGDVFFGDKYQYSYNLSIVSEGYTLPYINNAGWQNNINVQNTYENILYPQIYKQFNKAISDEKGFFELFNSPNDVQNFVYLKKPNGKWTPFWSGTPNNSNSGKVSNFLENKE
ncbi:Uncharacterised protein [Mycoplasmopsis citelli]|uniref:TNase-like domain-containing protein n=1 Tax=Mycoplasmopsis citelli TaxID=171281 RepID=A0A449B1K3_9BACT|nr:thermonuclease family protein [Mycoplasmopsis citelli]VEU74480.1 Uncharacterised protein [Mycoplasmopsis citelli]